MFYLGPMTVASAAIDFPNQDVEGGNGTGILIGHGVLDQNTTIKDVTRAPQGLFPMIRIHLDLRRPSIY
jgi:hypothetical protein